VFVVSYDNPVLKRTGLYRFGLTRAGKVTGFGPVPGGALPGLVNVTLAVSPDGSQVAIAGTPAPRRLGDNPVQPGKIVIVDLATGASRVWQGGMDRPGQQFSIPSVSWTADGKSLVYVAQWCTPQLAYPSTGSCDTDSNVQPSGPVARVQEISVAGRGGRLTSGEVLLRQSARYPKILQALVAPDGQLVALVAHGLHPYLVRFAVPSGRPLAVLYDGQFLHTLLLGLGLGSASLASDSSGRYLLLDINKGFLAGWVHHGQLHLWSGPGSGNYAPLGGVPAVFRAMSIRSRPGDRRGRGWPD